MLTAAKSRHFIAGVVWEDMAVISPPPPPSSDHMINELMSGPDEELGMNESPSQWRVARSVF